MCGIVGFLDTTGNGNGTIGKTVLEMLSHLAARGPDSAGVALYGPREDEAVVVQIKLGKHNKASFIEEKIQELGSVREARTRGESLRVVMELQEGISAVLKFIESLDEGIEIVSMGNHLEVMKQVGTPQNLDDLYDVSHFMGTHGLGHTRLSTESIIDLSHSQPFWAYGYLDLAIVHNGHITNYHKMRQLYEQKGATFYTENDSEIIAVYFADKMSQGMAVQDVLEASVTDFDGAFSYLVSTPECIGFAKDRFAFKPLFFTETDDFVAVATEEIAIRPVFAGSYTVREAQSGEVRTWRR